MSLTRITPTSLATWIRDAKVEPTFASQTVCGIVACTSIPFVEVRSREQRAHICLHHFQEARTLATREEPVVAGAA